ncbi:MAG: hypothetical protein BWK80_17600 [Desulfobacteraceae bacterium IS3]|nr:MAG: hypothetical protein BWK80_17600 [Desulfobacteraceae bacterium IS3]
MSGNSCADKKQTSKTVGKMIKIQKNKDIHRIIGFSGNAGIFSVYYMNQHYKLKTIYRNSGYYLCLYSQFQTGFLKN